jgi:hypothetical protein
MRGPRVGALSVLIVGVVIFRIVAVIGVIFVVRLVSSTPIPVSICAGVGSLCGVLCFDRAGSFTGRGHVFTRHERGRRQGFGSRQAVSNVLFARDGISSFLARRFGERVTLRGIAFTCRRVGRLLFAGFHAMPALARRTPYLGQVGLERVTTLRDPRAHVRGGRIWPSRVARFDGTATLRDGLGISRIELCDRCRRPAQLGVLLRRIRAAANGGEQAHRGYQCLGHGSSKRPGAQPVPKRKSRLAHVLPSALQVSI